MTPPPPPHHPSLLWTFTPFPLLPTRVLTLSRPVGMARFLPLGLVLVLPFMLTIGASCRQLSLSCNPMLHEWKLWGLLSLLFWHLSFPLPAFPALGTAYMLLVSSSVAFALLIFSCLIVWNLPMIYCWIPIFLLSGSPVSRILCVTLWPGVLLFLVPFLFPFTLPSIGVAGIGSGFVRSLCLAFVYSALALAFDCVVP